MDSFLDRRFSPFLFFLSDLVKDELLSAPSDGNPTTAAVDAAQAADVATARVHLTEFNLGDTVQPAAAPSSATRPKKRAKPGRAR